MIKSEMISFRAQNVVQRDIPQYISLVQQVYASLRDSSNSQNLSNLNNVAASIRQVVLKNDCLQQKNDILDFFFLCEKQINNGTKKQTKKSNKESKSWIKIVQKNINHIKGLYNLCLKLKNMQLKRGFACLNIKNHQNEEEYEAENNIDPSSIQVQQDIRLKTLYFFRWCKFIEYGKSIKKLRLKQIDDLRKSLTFNQYAVKFSYFHNWRKISKMSTLNKERFNQIQLLQKKSLFKQTVNSFYGLFEIKKIEQKLCQKVKQSLSVCSKQKFFKRLNSCSQIQKSKSIENILLNKIFQQKRLRVEKLKYQFLFYIGEILQTQKAKTRTLSQNLIKSEQNYSILCAKSALNCLKNQVILTKQNTHALNEKRKEIILKQKFDSFTQRKNIKINQQLLSNILEKKKLARSIQTIILLSSLKKKILNQNTQPIDSSDSCLNQNQKESENHSCQLSFGLDGLDKSLRQHFDNLNKKQVLNTKMVEMKVSSFLGRLRQISAQQKSQHDKINMVLIQRKASILDALKICHKRKLSRDSNYQFLQSVYHKNILKNAFKSFHSYKQMRLSHQDCLSAIQQKIINPKQISYAFQKILERKYKIDSSTKMLTCLEKAQLRFVFQKCFYQHKYVMLKFKQMQKISELRKLKLLFDMLKKNQENNQMLSEQIKNNVIAKISKQRFINLFKYNFDHEQKKLQLFYLLREQNQTQFVKSLKQKKQQSEQLALKQTILSKFLAFSLFKSKFQEQKKTCQILQSKTQNLQSFLCGNKLDFFIRALNQQKNIKLDVENKQIQLQILLAKNKLKQLVKKASYQQKHNPLLTKQKVQTIFTQINYSSFYCKFSHHAKRNYMNRWMDWKKKSLIFQKLQDHQKIIKNQKHLTKNLQNLQISNAWNHIKSNIEYERQIIFSKQDQLCDFLEYNRRKQVVKIVSKFYSVKQTQELHDHLKNSIKTKYFSKFMRNSLVTKYQKVKQFCAIKSYARNLKQKSWNGLKIMLMRLRDKENRIKTQQQLIIKIDKAMYQSRKTNKLTETIQRFNSSMKNGGFGGMMR